MRSDRPTPRSRFAPLRFIPLFILLLAGILGPAAADWGTPQRLDPTDPESLWAWGTQLDANAAGDALAIWSEYVEASDTNPLYLSWYRDGAWSEPELLRDDTNTFYAPAILHDDGTAWVLWHGQTDGDTRNRIYASHFDGNTWLVPVAIDDAALDDIHSGTLRVTENGAGKVTAVWAQYEDGGSEYRIFSARYSGGAWQPAERIDLDSGVGEGGTSGIALSANAAGQAMAAWTQDHDASGRNRVFAARFDGSAWQTPEIVDQDDGVQFSGANDVWMDAAGNAFVTWSAQIVADSDRYRISVRRVDKDDNWGTTQTFDIGEASYDQFARIAGDGLGNALLVWNHRTPYPDITRSDLRYSRFNGAWSTPANVTGALLGDSDHIDRYDLVVDNWGNATLIWAQNDTDGDRRIFASRSSGGPWSEPITLEVEGDPELDTVQFDVNAVIDGMGNVLVSWEHNATGGDDTFVYVNHYRMLLPTPISLSPSGTAAGSAAFTLTVTGENFAAGDVVLWNGMPRTTQFVSATQLQAAITAADVATAGVAAVSVRRSDGSATSAVSLPFTIGALAPAVDLDPTSLDFGDQQVGTTSDAGEVTLSNPGAADLTVSGLSVVGPFTLTHDCGTLPFTLAPGADCTLSLRFAPQAIGAQNGAVALEANTTNGTHLLSLAGNGLAAPDTPPPGTPVIELDPASLVFGQQTVGTTSATQAIVLGNSGDAALAIQGISALGPFTLTHDCGATLAAGADCTLTIRFTPIAAGVQQGAVVVDSALGTHLVVLSGTGVAAPDTPTPAPAIELDPATLDFGEQAVGVASAARTVTLRNTGNAVLTLQGVTLIGPYGASHDCGSNLAAGASCDLQVRFTPTATGSQQGALVLASALGTHVVVLNGSGIAAGQTPDPDCATADCGGGDGGNGGSDGGGTDDSGTDGGNAGGDGSSDGNTGGGISMSGGCSLGSTDAQDPLLPALLLVALGAAVVRRAPRPTH
ncbi:MAG: choice-of-anchor D domain-containing protein [Ectothiorhodospiraceae bacterium]|jgi:hypothetical protein|nr:choice-of-anchor D domain-containing protein [Ectothiorhodospiraceae bacterium]